MLFTMPNCARSLLALGVVAGANACLQAKLELSPDDSPVVLSKLTLNAQDPSQRGTFTVRTKIGRAHV